MRCLTELCGFAQKHDVDLHLRISGSKPPWNIAEAREILGKVKRAKPARRSKYRTDFRGGVGIRRVISGTGFWLAGAPAYDIGGGRYSVP